jgi:hypothetical protein
MKTENVLPSTLSIRSSILIILSLMTILAFAQKTSVSNTNWSTGATWSPSGVPASGNTVIVNNAVMLDKNLTTGSGISGSLTINFGKSLIASTNENLEIKNGGTLTIDGLLEINSLTFLNGSNVNITSTGIVVVHGDFLNDNNSNNIIVNGKLTIYGSAYNGAGGLISGSGHINTVGGAFTGSGSISGTVVLPVELLDFSLIENNSKVSLSWTTGSELNNDYFTIEKSVNGVDFQLVAQVKGAGSSSMQHQYSLGDEVSSGTTYYRLKQTDFNGESVYCGGVITCNLYKKDDINVHPNPVVDSNLYVNMHDVNFGILTEVMLTDMSGKEIYRFFTRESNTVISIPQAIMKTGMYILSVNTGGKIISKKIVVK